MSEEWRRLPGRLAYYEVSNLGAVRSVRGVLKQGTTKKGYKTVGLWINGRSMVRKTHTLVALAFIGPCPEGKEVNHKDTNRANNRADNLEYLTSEENSRHALMHGYANRKVSPEDVRRIRSGGIVVRAEARRLGVAPKHIRNIRDGKVWSSVE